MSTIEYKFFPHHEVKEGIITWRYNKYSTIEGPFIIVNRSVEPGAAFFTWHLLDTTTGKIVECPQRQLRKAVICN